MPSGCLCFSPTIEGLSFLYEKNHTRLLYASSLTFGVVHSTAALFRVLRLRRRHECSSLKCARATSSSWFPVRALQHMLLKPDLFSPQCLHCEACLRQIALFYCVHKPIELCLFDMKNNGKTTHRLCEARLLQCCIVHVMPH